MTEAKKASREGKTRKSQRYIKKSKGQRKISLERIKELFKQAGEVFREGKAGNDGRALAKRYVTLARKIAMKYKISIPSKLKRQFCKKCNSFLIPSINARVRLNKGKVVYLCLECKHIGRVGYRKKK